MILIKKMNNKYLYYKGLLITLEINLRKFKEIIINELKGTDIDPNIVYGILLIEFANRSNSINKISEKFICWFFPNFAIKRNLSIGLTQIKISTAKLFIDLDDTKIIQLLCNDKDNIIICTKYVKWIFNKFSLEKSELNYQIFVISNIYNSGTMRNYLLPWIKFYTDLLNFSVDKNWIGGDQCFI